MPGAGCLLGVLLGAADAPAATGRTTLAASDFHPTSNRTVFGADVSDALP